MQEFDGAKLLNSVSLPASPLRYDSRSEFALCTIFERYIPGWKPVMNETFQISIFDKRIDFQIQSTLLEFHPIMINRELKSSDANTLFRQIYKRASRFEREQLVDLLTAELGAQYSARRWQLIQSSEHRGKQFVVCKNEFEVYKNIIKRFAPNPPKLEQFKNEFYAAIARAT